MFTYYRQQISVPVAAGSLKGCLTVPVKAKTIVIFAQAGGYSRETPESELLEHYLQKAGFGTLLVDLTVDGEEPAFGAAADVIRSGDRLTAVALWILRRDLLGKYQYGFLASHVEAAAAIRSVAALAHRIGAVVCRRGRLELASDSLGLVATPVLMVAGSNEPYVLAVNREAIGQLRCDKKLVAIEGAGNRFDDAACARFSEFAVDWYKHYLQPATLSMANA